MLICDENNETIIIDSTITPVISDYFWVLDLEISEFTLIPILYFQESVSPSILVEVNGFKFVLPANWNLLVYDPDTMQLDVVEISDLSSSNFTALVYGPNFGFIKPANVRTLDYRVSYKNVSPSLNKHQMMCHPISPDSWVVISPSDNYGKFLKDKTVGDII